MGRIRFVTAMCLGALVCEAYDDDVVAIDGITPPWLVFEWFVIEALARAGEDTRGAGIPGLQKVTGCLAAQRQVSAAAYLKTPKVFGFSGIFRRLATNSKILDDGMRLDEGGWELLRAWERDQSLVGLVHGKQGAGAGLVRELRAAVSRGVDAGSTVSRPGAFWSELAMRLHPASIGKREGEVLLRRLHASSPLTSEHIDLLERQAVHVARDDEPAYLRRMARRSSVELAAHLDAVDAYESLCRPVVDAFDLVRHLSTHRSLGPISAAEFAASSHAAGLVEAIAEGCRRVERDPHLLDWQPDVRVVVDGFGDIRTATGLFDAVVDHHEASQRRKPPDGKRPWIERVRDGAVMVRPAYPVPVREEAPSPYVHDYRTRTLCGFLADTGVIS